MNTLQEHAPWSWILLFSLLLVTIPISGCGGAPPENLGLENGGLKPCPESPNCVSTRKDEDPEHHMEAISLKGNPEEAMDEIVKTVEQEPRAEITHQNAGYLRAEFTSRIFRFVDDVEFSIDEQESLIRFRSASRLGESDMGANRERMTELREDLKAKLGK